MAATITAAEYTERVKDTGKPFVLEFGADW